MQEEINIKPLATILDATASNRSMWKTKDSKFILFIDIETELEIPPDKIMDCRKTHFSNSSINMIFFDPPHWWGDEIKKSLYTCRNKNENNEFRDKHNLWTFGGYTYYGTDKFKTKTSLLSFIHKAQEEFYRILKNDGVLWLIWSDVKLPLSKILPFFKNWKIMLRLPVVSPNQVFSKKQNWWVMLMKKPTTTRTPDLSEFCELSDTEEK